VAGIFKNGNSRRLHGEQNEVVGTRIHTMQIVFPLGLLATALAGCGKTRWRAYFGKGTSSLVPISSLILSFRGGFSRRGICFSEFFRSLLAFDIGGLSVAKTE